MRSCPLFMLVRIPSRSFALVAPSVAPKAARSRLRRPPLLASEFAPPACLDSIAGPGDGQVHSAYIPDHGNRPGDRQLAQSALMSHLDDRVPTTRVRARDVRPSRASRLTARGGGLGATQTSVR